MAVMWARLVMLQVQRHDGQAWWQLRMRLWGWLTGKTGVGGGMYCVGTGMDRMVQQRSRQDGRTDGAGGGQGAEKMETAGGRRRMR